MFLKPLTELSDKDSINYQQTASNERLLGEKRSLLDFICILKAPRIPQVRSKLLSKGTSQVRGI